MKGGYDENDGKWYFGRTRIIFVNEFTNHDEYNFKYDTIIDFDAIKTSFEKLQFKVEKAIFNPTAARMIACFKEEIDYFGCAIIFIFSGGEHDYIYCSDYDAKTGSGKINICNDFYHYFSAEEKPKLKDCPKVFFNECGQDRRNVTTEYVKNNISRAFRNTTHWLIYNADLPRFETCSPDFAGSCYTQVFCKLLNEIGKEKDLQSITSLVKGEVSKNRDVDKKDLQSISFSSMNRKLYLLPEEEIYQLKVNEKR